MPLPLVSREYLPASDSTFVTVAERLYQALDRERNAPRPADETLLRTRFERQLRRRFPYAVVQPLPPAGGVTVRRSSGWRIYRDGGPSQSRW